MNTKENTVSSSVETLDINLDEIFNGAPGAGDVTLPTEEKDKPNIFTGRNKKADFSFADPDEDGVDDLTAKSEEAEETKETEKEDVKMSKEDTDDIMDSLTEDDEETEPF